VSTPEVPPHPTLTKYYGSAEERDAAVRKLFDAGARDYELVCWLMSMGTGESYRGQVLKEAGLSAGMRLLDVATGTGLVLRSGTEIVGASGLAIGLDPSSGMLHECRTRSQAPLVQARGEQLPFASGHFDMVSMGYALRHVPDLVLLFNEYRRVLKPGGRVVILEVAQPASTVGRRLNKMFLQTIVPRIAQISTGRADARRMMDYFWDTIETCVPPDVILSALARAGFEATRKVTGGVLGQYLGTVKAGA
jgi:demethylmenaquinone methyltransferase/2-methoxy-6-polyprenyl-1,4-benzoquinol methylase